MNKNKWGKAMKTINFVGLFPFCTSLSAIFVVLSLITLSTKGLNYGVDFKGGAEIQVKFSQDIDDQKIRGALEEKKLSVSSIKSIGEKSNLEFLIKVPASEAEINTVTENVTASLTNDLASFGPDIRRTDIVGPKAGEQLRLSGFWALVWSLLGIMIYIGLRFDFRFSPGAVVALFHDVGSLIESSFPCWHHCKFPQTFCRSAKT